MSSKPVSTQLPALLDGRIRHEPMLRPEEFAAPSTFDVRELNLVLNWDERGMMWK
jgi:hypothetical protein